MILNMLSTEESINAALAYTGLEINKKKTMDEYIKFTRDISHNKSVYLMGTLKIMRKLGISK